MIDLRKLICVFWARSYRFATKPRIYAAHAARQSLSELGFRFAKYQRQQPILSSWDGLKNQEAVGARVHPIMILGCQINLMKKLPIR